MQRRDRLPERTEIGFVATHASRDLHALRERGYEDCRDLHALRERVYEDCRDLHALRERGYDFTVCQTILST